MPTKFLCLNLWQGGNLFDETLAFIRTENPDIIALQEVYDGHDPAWERKFRSMDVLQAELDYPHHHFAPAFLERTDFGKVEQGNAVLSRFPIVETEVTFYDVPFGEREDKPGYYEQTPRNLQRVRLDVQGKELHVLNTQGIWGHDGRDNDRRMEMGRVIAEQIGRCAAKPLLLAGDFNLNPETKTISLIEASLANIFKGRLVSTFNMQHKTNPVFATAVVDMIFVSPSLQVIEKSCPAVDVSDHLPLLASLEIR